jgi:hypothetical protein
MTHIGYVKPQAFNAFEALETTTGHGNPLATILL